MRHLTVVRSLEVDKATLGHVENEQRRLVLKVLERLYVDANKDGLSDPSVSRIPAGTYRAVLEYSPAHGRKLWELKGVPGRSEIQFHSGAVVAHSKGCVLTGTRFGAINGEIGILYGKAGETLLAKELEGEVECLITFIDPPPAIELPPPTS